MRRGASNPEEEFHYTFSIKVHLHQDATEEERKLIAKSMKDAVNLFLAHRKIRAPLETGYQRLHVEHGVEQERERRGGLRTGSGGGSRSSNV